MKATAEIRVYRRVPLASFTGYGDVILLDYGAPMSPPASHTAIQRAPGLVHEYLSSIPPTPISAVLDDDPSRIRIGLTSRVVDGEYALLYTPGGTRP